MNNSNLDKSSGRFIVVDGSDERVPEHERGDFGWHIIDTSDGSWVASDGGEPEDQLFVRDLNWITPTLNKLAARIDELEQQLDHAESELPLAIKLWRKHDNKTRTRVKRILINKDGMSVGATAALVLDYIESAPARVISAIVSAECKITSGSSRTCRRGTRGCTIRHKLDKS